MRHCILSSNICTNIEQCAIPVFEGLLPEPHNSIVMDMLFTLAVWHALAKLRLHTDSTLAGLETETSVLGKVIRHFLRTTCEAYATKELPGEQQQRARRQSKKDGAKGTTKPTPIATTVKRKSLNLLTYKFHALGDYVKTILRFGTSDSYSTQVVSGNFVTLLSYLIITYSRVNSSTAV